MAGSETVWNAEHSQRFSNHEDTFRGYIRYEVTRHNLASTLQDYLSQPRRIVDIGGGQGQDAKWLAGQEQHDVYLIEPDLASVQKAMEGNNGLIQIVRGDVRTALEGYGSESFDLLLSHCVLQYQADPQAELTQLAGLIKKGGYISTLNAGLLGKLNRAQDRGDKTMLDGLLLTSKFSNNLNISSRAFLPQDMEKMLELVGFEVVDWFGVRIFSDDDPRLVDEVPAFHRNRLLEREIEASTDSYLRPAGQLLHHIARKIT